MKESQVETQLLKEIKSVLATYPKYWNGKELVKNRVVEDIRSYDEEVIESLLSNELIRKTYAIQLESGVVFKIEDFIDMLNYKNYLDNSYTKYANEIGLTSDRRFLKYNTDIVLDFPHKDGVLEGGMSKEISNKEEVFYHSVLAKEEIDVLLSPKVLTNVRRHDKNGEQDATEIDENDSLVIRGNNLIALSSLLQRYEGKVKCIYIDPPYNPRSDANTFAYNNRFNQSTWLTFMKNRLELASRLLADDGIIFIDIDHNELFYLGVLADEIFGYENRIGNLAVVHNLKGRYNGYFSIAHENKIVYAKNSENAEIKEMLDDTSHKYPYEDDIGKYKIVNLQRTGNGSLREDRPNLFYPVYYDLETGQVSTTKIEGAIEILPIDDKGIERRWRWKREKLEKEWKTETVVRKQKSGYKIYTKIRQKGDRPKTLWNKPEYSGTTGTNRLKKLIGENDFSYPKSVQLVVDSLSIATDEDSIVLDFFGGSGTTGEAVMELNKIDNGSRKFILVEQMSYIETILTPRLKRVIESEQSNESFIYAELFELNQSYITKIQEATTKEEMLEIRSIIKESKYLNIRVDFDKMLEKTADFYDLSLTEQKELLIQLLDMNQLYLNYSEIEDTQYGITDDIKDFNHSFYKKEGGNNE